MCDRLRTIIAKYGLYLSIWARKTGIEIRYRGAHETGFKGDGCTARLDIKPYPMNGKSHTIEHSICSWGANMTISFQTWQG